MYMFHLSLSISFFLSLSIYNVSVCSVSAFAQNAKWSAAALLFRVVGTEAGDKCRNQDFLEFDRQQLSLRGS